jgi:hypothetical protein
MGSRIAARSLAVASARSKTFSSDSTAFDQSAKIALLQLNAGFDLCFPYFHLAVAF